jgi:PPK2 family polyphosphate:nucleotide phosphotransferase
MFAAAPHPLLVPHDGRFDTFSARTKDDEKDMKSKDWKNLLAEEMKALGDAQYRLFADGRYAVLVVLQALDAAGKDGTIRHVFSGINPCGLRVTSFKAPTKLEQNHDFLWRTAVALPERGTLGVFNRSYYEEVLVVRVHPEFLAAQRIDAAPSTELWAARLRAIADHERHLAEQGTLILKFWLNLSKDEQRKRLLERIDDPDKHWKFNFRDLDERDRWADYLVAYHECLNATSRPWAPWYAVPADDKHYLRWQVANIVRTAIEGLDVGFPRAEGEDRAAFEQARARLMA